MFFPAAHLFFLVIAPQLWLHPFVGLRVDYIILPMWFFYLIASGKFSNIRFGPQEKFFIFFIFWVFLSQVVNGVITEHWKYAFFYVKWFFLYLMISATLETIHGVKKYIIFFIILSIILSIEGIYHFQNDIGWAGQTLGWSEEGVKGRTRWVGIFDGPGVFCVIYTIALPFIINFMQKIYGGTTRLLFALLFILNVVGIYLNGSRGGFLTALAIIGMYFYPHIKKNKGFIIIASAIIVVIFIIAPSHMTNMNDEHHSSSHRVELWAEGCEMLKQNPVFGIGRGEFRPYTGKLVAHNSFVEIMGEAGFVGLFAYMGLIYFSLKNLYVFISPSAIDETPGSIKEKALAQALMISILGYLVSAMFVTLEYETIYMLYALSAVFGSRTMGAKAVSRNDVRNIGIATIGWVIYINLFTLLLGPGFFLPS